MVVVGRLKIGEGHIVRIVVDAQHRLSLVMPAVLRQENQGVIWTDDVVFGLGEMPNRPSEK